MSNFPSEVNTILYFTHIRIDVYYINFIFIGISIYLDEILFYLNYIKDK